MTAPPPREPLLGARWRAPAIGLAVLGAAVFLALAVATFHKRYVLFDRAAFRVLPEHISTTVANGLLQFTEPAVSVMLLAFVVVFALSRRRYDLATLAVVAPVLGTVLASYVFKPIVHRTLFNGTVGSYPSGHETGVVCTATVLLIAFGQLQLGRRTRAALAAVLVAWAVIAAVGLTRYYYHYATDTVGAAGWSIALVIGLALAADRWWPRPSGRTPRHRSDAQQQVDASPSDQPPAAAPRPSPTPAPTATRRPTPGRPQPARRPRPVSSPVGRDRPRTVPAA